MNIKVEFFQDDLIQAIGAGIYEISINQNNKSEVLYNDYLFGCCFNPKISEHNCKRFIDYLLSNLICINTFSGKASYVPNLNEDIIPLDKKKLIKYWQLHGSTIKSVISGSMDREVHTSSYTATYANDVEGVYKVLDEALAKALENDSANSKEESES